MTMIHHFDTHLYASRLKKAGFAEDQVETLIDLARDSQPKDIVTNENLEVRFARFEVKMSDNFKDLYKHLWAMAAGIVTVTVALLKLIP